MGRRTGVFEDLADITSRLPWWAGVLLAAVSYWGLSALAAGLTQSVTTKGVPAAVMGALALAASFALPLAFLAGAAMSAYGRARRKKLLASAGEGGAAAVAGMGWREFEMLVGEAFRQRGYTVTETGGGGPDGGVDLALRRGDERALVQCKHWKSYRVGLPVVREMLGAMTAHRASAGWVITSGRFTAEARAFAREHRIELVDGDALPALLKPARAAPSGSGLATAAVVPPAAPLPAASAQGAPGCPVCGKAMVLRVAGKSARAGQSFWGCSAFPGCRGTRPGAVKA